MSERRRRGRPPGGKDAGGREDPEDAEVSVLEQPQSEADHCRTRLRRRWELASVLNFMHVFQPVIQSELKVSAEEMEMALILPDETLAGMHIALLKGIPPVSKNLVESNVWVTVLCKKLKMWWPWVAEGEVPLVADRGEEILRYKNLDPVTRLVILKALCEIRVQQDDILRYIDEEVKHGGQISKFRKVSLGGDDNGTTYWYDGDSIIGHRLYRNTTKVEFQQKLKGRGCLTQPAVNFQWETLATNFKEFQEISDRLSCSKISSESAVGNILKVGIMPAVEELEKKKERALKRKQKQAMLLDSFENCNLIRSRRSCRDRRPVSYTFDEFDRSINEAIQEAKRISSAGSKKGEDECTGDVAVGNHISTESLHQDPGGSEIQASNGELDGDKYWGSGDDDDNDDDDEDFDYEHCDSHGYMNTHSNFNDRKGGDSPRLTRLRSTENKKCFRGRDFMGLHRRMTRASNGAMAHGMGQVEMKKRLRERPTPNAGCNLYTITDSEGGSTSGEEQR